MAKYPVESDDNVGVIDALNYLLSGPAGLGQNFDGFSTSTTQYLTGNFTEPYFKDNTQYIQTNQIPLATGEYLDDVTVKFTFTTTLGYIPFDNGNPLYALGTSDSNYNGLYIVGVLECTNSYVIVRSLDPFVGTLPSPCTGGFIQQTSTYNAYIPGDTFQYAFLPTDCNSYATVTGASDKVFISGQIDFGVGYTVSTGTENLSVHIVVNRYKAVPNTLSQSPQYQFIFDKTVSSAIYQFNNLTGTNVTPFNPGPSFVSIIDQPEKGYYWYAIELQFVRSATHLYVEYFFSKKRSLSTQVVKQ